MSGIFEYFNERRKLIDRGLLGYRRESVAFFNTRPERMMKAKAAISQQTRAEKSDPYLYNRLMSSITSGAANIEDFNIDWVGEQKNSPMLEAFRKIKDNVPKLIDVLSPRNRKLT